MADEDKMRREYDFSGGERGKYAGRIKKMPVEMERLKAAWEVRAGIVPGTPIPEYTKRFTYTSRDSEEDGEHAKEIGYQPLFMKQMACATAYHQQMSNPSINNWAELTFIWY